jgi:hypothetical protein
MRPIILAAVVTLAGCASSPDYVARQSNWDVCRLSMGGPHSAAAEVEARNRGVDCAPMYPAIQATEARRAAAAAQMLQSRPAYQPYQAQPYQMPQQTTCTSYRVGNSVETRCN